MDALFGVCILSNDIPSKVGLSVLLIYITRESKPYTVDEVEWWPHFSFLMPQNLKETASLGHRCNDNYCKYGRKKM